MRNRTDDGNPNLILIREDLSMSKEGRGDDINRS